MASSFAPDWFRATNQKGLVTLPKTGTYTLVVLALQRHWNRCLSVRALGRFNAAALHYNASG